MSLTQPIQIADGVYQLRTLGAKVTVLFGSQGLALVDAGARGSMGLIESGLRALGSSLLQVRLIVLTHYHPDHTGNLRKLVEATGAKVAAHEDEADIISGKREHPSPFINRLWARVTRPFLPLLHDPHPTQVDYMIDDGDMLPFSEEVRVIHTPGHTPGSICLYVVSSKVLIVGDALQYRFHRLSPPAPSVTQDRQQAIQSLGKLLSLEFDTICFGHHSPLCHGAREALERLVQRVNVAS